MLREAVKGILDGLTLRREMAYTLFDRTRDLATTPEVQSGGVASRRAILIQALAKDIYSHLNEIPRQTKIEGPERKQAIAPLGMDTRPAGLDLLAPNGYAIHWYGADRITLPPGRYLLPSASGRQPATRDVSWILADTARADAQPGWIFHTLHAPISAAPGQISRIYVDLDPRHGSAAVRICTQWSETNGVAMALKYAIAATARRDAMVLYLSLNQAFTMAPEISMLCEQLSDMSRRRQALMTLAIKPGVGYAEDPVSGISYGISRSVIIAEMALDVKAGGRCSDTEVERICHRCQVDPRHVWRSLVRGPRPTLCGIAC